MESSRSSIPIEPGQLDQFTEQANRLLTSAKWTPKQEFQQLFSGKAPGREGAAPAWRDSSASDAREEEVSLIKIAKLKSNDSLLLSEDITHVMQVVRQGLRVGMHLSKTYTQFSGLDQLIALNSKGGLVEQQKAEFRAKYYTASAIAVLATSYYITWELSSYKAEVTSGLPLEFPGIPELSLQNPVRALDCLAFYFGAFLERTQSVQSGPQIVKLSLLYFRAAADDIVRRADSFQYAEPFTAQTYKLGGSEFTVNGFTAEVSGTESSVAFNRVELAEIVGNRDAKHDARRLAQRLLCYDLETQKNPILELGGLTTVHMGYGEPGTGKSMLISALATMLSDYCENLGVPFLFWPMPDTVVSTFQGGSAERMMSWMQVLKDPNKIIYAPIDDAENNLEERTRQGVSAGVREVIAVFLRNTEGAYALNRGNCVIQLFTNIPDQIDKAVLSRVNTRSYIGGAQSTEDFIDQDHLWTRRYQKVDPSFIRMKDPKTYQYLSAQQELASAAALFDGRTTPTNPQLATLFEQTVKDHKLDDHAFFGAFFAAVKKEYVFFTSRDLRNIQRSIDSRIMDFDMPQEWFEDATLFCKKDYDTKKAMIVELMKQTMRGLSFAEIRLQETVRYLDTMVDIAEQGRERKVSQLAEDMELHKAAQQRIKGL